MKTTTIITTALVAIGLFGCIEGDNYIRFTDYVTMEASLLPDTMILNETYNIEFRASAPNGCWSNIKVYTNTKSDSLFYFSAAGTYENHGETCSTQIVTHDTIISFTPKVSKTHILYFYNPTGDPQIRVDTVYIKSE